MDNNNDLVLDDDLITKCLNELFKKQANIKQYFDYYEGNQKILHTYQQNDGRSNYVVLRNFCRQMVNNFAGYMLSKPVNYISVSGNDGEANAITSAFSLWEKEHNITMCKNAQIAGESYEAISVDGNGNFIATSLNPLNTYVVEDGSEMHNILLALNIYWQPFNFTDTFMDLYTDTEIRHYKIGSYTGQGQLTLLGTTPHIFGVCPVLVLPANYERRSSIADIMLLNDAYNQICSDSVNTISDNRLAFLVISGCTVDADTLTKMKQSGVINLPDSGNNSSVEYLIKNISDSFTKETLDRIHQDIYDSMNTPDMSMDNFSSNTSGSALSTTLLQLSNAVGIAESFMDKMLKQRIQLFFTYLSKVKNVNYDVSDISISFTNNLPADLSSLADAFSKLADVVPKETILANLPFVTSPATELKKLKEQQQQDTPIVTTTSTESQLDNNENSI